MISAVQSNAGINIRETLKPWLSEGKSWQARVCLRIFSTNVPVKRDKELCER